MIQVYKSPDPPEKHNSGKTYNSQEVQDQLIADQSGKCYLCEREVVTDFQIDHLHSRSNYPEEVTEWQNLLLSCSYCNNKKSSFYDHIISPTQFPIEVMIRQEINYVENKAVFIGVNDSNSKDITETIKLLNFIFNGREPARKVREERFYEYFLSQINLFKKACNNFLENSSKDNKDLVRYFLKDDKEFLGFKYWIVQSNKRLKENFASECVWHRNNINQA